MLYDENITIEMKTTLFGKPGIKSLDTEATISPLGDEMQFDLNLKNRDLLHRKFTIDENCIIRHGRDNYRCTGNSFTKGRPHHVVVYAKPLD